MSDLPVTNAGVAFDQAWCDTAEFQDTGFERVMEGGKHPSDQELQTSDFSAQLDVWMKEKAVSTEPNEALVRLTFVLAPRNQPTYKVKVGYVGHFRGAPNAEIPFDDYTQVHALTYLVPFIRAKIAALTAESRFPKFILPPLDVDLLLNVINEARSARSQADDSPVPSP